MSDTKADEVQPSFSFMRHWPHLSHIFREQKAQADPKPKEEATTSSSNDEKKQAPPQTVDDDEADGGEEDAAERYVLT